jgi:hypothetical protein
MIIQVIRTPFDFEETLEAPVGRVNCWLPPAAEQGGIVDLVGELFGHRGELRREAPEEAAAHLDSLAGPLQGLQRIGLQLVAMLTRERYVIRRAGSRGGLTPAMVDTADYLVAPDPCYFRAAGADFSAPIHKLGTGCQAGHRLIVDGSDEKEKTFRVWTELEEVARDFELAVPWCPVCRRADLEKPRSRAGS